MTIELIFNLALLIALSIVSGFIEKHWSQHTHHGRLLQGILFGSAAVIGMLHPLDLGSGLIFDGRSVMVSLCAFFFGPLAGVVAASMTILCRMTLGGAGTLTGVLVILASLGIGWLAHVHFQPIKRIPSARTLYLFGLLVHLVMLGLMFTLPGGAGPAVLARIGLPVILLYPLATILVGKILSDQVSSIHTLEALQKSNQKLQVTLESIGDAVISTDTEGDIVFMNPVAEALTGWPQAEAGGKPHEHIFNIINETTRQPADNPVAKALRDGMVVGLANHTLLIARDGSERPIADSAAPIRSINGQVSGVVLVFRDQSEERRVQRLMQTRLALLENERALSLETFLTQALDSVTALVDSPLGFFHLVDDDQKTLFLQQWSSRTLEECQVEQQELHLALDWDGLWAQCIRQGKPIVHNDFAALPNSKVQPPGHPEMVRQLVVPVLCKGKVVALLGVGNKATDYHQQDIASLVFVADEIWRIVEKKRAEDQLRENEQFFRDIFHNHAAAKLIVDPDSGQIIEVNQAAADYYGWSKQQLTRMTVQDINTLPPQEVARELNRVKTLGKINSEFQHRRADGSVRDVEVFSSRIHAKGQALLYAIVHDITSRKTAEKELQAREVHFRQLVENAPDAIFVQTAGRFAYLNKTAVQLFGARTDEELIGTPVLERFHSDIRESVKERIRILNQDKQNVPLRHEVCLRMDGSSLDVEASAVPMRYAGEDGALVFLRNISERLAADKSRQKLEEQLQQAQKIETVGRLAGGVAHDYNNMLSVIIGYAELGQMRLPPADPMHDDFNQILNAAKRSRDITRQLLAFARKQTLSPRSLDLNATIEDILKMLTRLIGENIDLVWRPTEGLWRVEMDPSQLDQILANLCINASDAIGDVGKITIETDMVRFDQAYCDDHAGFLPGDYVKIAVSDDGCGMDKETLEHIFEPFFTTKKTGTGTGLGLSTVYGSIKQSDGFLNVYSEPGAGTIFKLYLPRYKGQLEEETTLTDEQLVRGQGQLVLVVEDEPLILNLTEKVLLDLGYKVLTALTPAKALALAEEYAGEIQLLMTDVVMPEMNGRELAERVWNLQPRLKCLYMSGYTANAIVHRGVLDKGLCFIQKPFSRNELGQKIGHLLLQSDDLV